MESNLKYTPATIALSKTAFSIPLYQRLFEWEVPQITQLLNDLYEGFKQKPNEPYYIGMLTAHKNDLVDGQQRFSVLMLMAIAFNWDKKFHILIVTDETNAPCVVRKVTTIFSVEFCGIIENKNKSFPN